MPSSKLRKKTNSDIDRYIGKELRLQRKNVGSSATEFAACLDLTLEEYQQIEFGLLRLSVSDLFTLKRIFDVSLLHFFSREGEYFSDIILTGSDMADVFHYFSNIENPKVKSYLLKQIKLASSVF